MRRRLAQVLLGVVALTMLLALSACAEVKLQEIILLPAKLYLNDAGSTANMKVVYRPDGASKKGVSWTSQNTAIATVDSNGKVTAKGKGTTTIVATSTSDKNIRAEAKVEVLNVPVTSLWIKPSTVSMPIGTKYSISAGVKPANASCKLITYESSDMDVAAVSADGMVTAIGMGKKNDGKATITVTSVAGNFKQKCEITVTTSLRAYIVANADYPGTSDDLGDGPIYDGECMQTLLSRNTFNGNGSTWKVTMSKNATKSNITSTIKQASKGAGNSDTFLFYFSGHGSYDTKTKKSYICTTDSPTYANWISVDNLKTMLDAIPGKKIVLLDCCHSGGFINRGSALDQSSANIDVNVINQFQQGVLDVFGGATSRALTGSSYHVITAASFNETSSQKTYYLDGKWRAAGEFTHEILNAVGYYSIGQIPADTNGDNNISVIELYRYIEPRVVSSSVKYSTNNESTVVFSFK